ncbi:hypothetical protein SAMN05216196_11233 [Lutimaribacter pacificus]|uniref:SmpA / OmlA family protein n=1 Tax=Lutimaribacter pacificus TaxID=391948 RepID=A0A1H0N8Y8_9RHOB|nr:outer membrane protein assembly factor BamE [Lutimaribacter pacificus]SDO88790.1 hypothetical protein SAMN05216196_11233 [Lutimaribacter pacificus]SHK85926.1 hypothetical protein SAMN05444142_11144 [Lutimaribacter pacificus]
MTRWFGARSVLLTIALVALLPVGPAGAQQGDRLNQVNPRVGFTSVSRAFPEMDARYARVGTRRNVAQVRSIAVGQPLNDVRATLGSPAVGYNDGSFEYHLSLPLTGRDRLICQYRVFFDDEGRLTHGVWRRPQCADLVLGR